MESQILGTPVIGARIGGIPELIRENITGLIFNPGDSDDLEKKVRFLLETPGVVELYSRNCFDISFETPESYHEEMLKIYGE